MKDVYSLCLTFLSLVRDKLFMILIMIMVVINIVINII